MKYETIMEKPKMYVAALAVAAGLSMGGCSAATQYDMRCESPKTEYDSNPYPMGHPCHGAYEGNRSEIKGIKSHAGNHWEDSDLNK
jgi:hypothetical protein